jgi:hypothetical protein
VGDAVLYGNHLHNATPAKGALVGLHTAYRLPAAVSLSVVHRLGCRVWVHNSGRPHTYRHELELRGVPDRFLALEGSVVSSVYRVLLDDGRAMQSQTIVFDEPACVRPPVLLSVAQAPAVMSVGGEDSDSDYDEVAPDVPPPKQPHAAAARRSRSCASLAAVAAVACSAAARGTARGACPPSPQSSV